MDAGLATWRKAQRARLAAERNGMSEEDRRLRSEALTAGLVRHLLSIKGVIVAAYWPLGGEFDPSQALDAARAAGRQIALPVVIGKGLPLEFRLWTEGAPLEPGVFGTRHPPAAPSVVPDVILAPMLGFDRAGYRLGYGGGYYDLTLAALTPRPHAIGLAFEIGRLDTIHPQPHDITMDVIITEAGVVGREI